VPNQAATSPTPSPSATATRQPSSTPTPTTAQLWERMEREVLGPNWGKDWPRVMAGLRDFLDHQDSTWQPAKGKLYSALVEYGKLLLDQQKTDEAVEQLVQARNFQPDRIEAPTLLKALTPTPVPPTSTPKPTPVPPTQKPTPAPEKDCATHGVIGRGQATLRMYPNQSSSFLVRSNNCGNTAWQGPEYASVLTGIRSGGINDLSHVAAGTGFESDIKFTAPSSPGTYTINYYMTRNGRRFGDDLVLTVVVVPR
jgi:hypothetical protein